MKKRKSSVICGVALLAWYQYERGDQEYIVVEKEIDRKNHEEPQCPKKDEEDQDQS
jgi:hypothetical protein